MGCPNAILPHGNSQPLSREQTQTAEYKFRPTYSLQHNYLPPYLSTKHRSTYRCYERDYFSSHQMNVLTLPYAHT